MTGYEILSAGSKLEVKFKGGSDFVELDGVVSTPEMGSSPEKVDVTNLADKNKRSINGLNDFGDSLEFGMNYLAENDQFDKLWTAQDNKDILEWKLSYPDGRSFAWQGQPSIKLGAVEVGKQVDYTLSITVGSTVTMTKPPVAGA